MVADCGHNPEPGFYVLCLACMHGMQQALIEVVEEYERLDASPSQGGGDGPSRMKPKSKSPANDHVISLRDHRVEGTLPRLLADTLRRFGQTPYPTVRGNRDALLNRAVMVSKAEWSPGFLADLRRVLAQLQRANGAPKRARVGRCDCGKPLYAPPSGVVVTCGCGLEYDTEAHVRWLTRETQ